MCMYCTYVWSMYILRPHTYSMLMYVHTHCTYVRMYVLTVCATFSKILLYLHVVWILTIYVCMVQVNSYTTYVLHVCVRTYVCIHCTYVCVHCVCYILQDPVLKLHILIYMFNCK